MKRYTDLQNNKGIIDRYLVAESHSNEVLVFFKIQKHLKKKFDANILYQN